MKLKQNRHLLEGVWSVYYYAQVSAFCQPLFSDLFIAQNGLVVDGSGQSMIK